MGRGPAKTITLRDLRVLARSQTQSGEDTVQTYYGWRESRAMTIAKGMGAASLSVLTAWLVPFLKHEYQGAPDWLVIVTPLALVVSLAISGLVSLMRMDVIHQAYIRATVWLIRLRS